MLYPMDTDYKSPSQFMGLLERYAAAQAQCKASTRQQLIRNLLSATNGHDKTPRTLQHLTQGRYFDILAECTSDFSMEAVYGHKYASHQSRLSGTKVPDSDHIRTADDEDGIKFETAPGNDKTPPCTSKRRDTFKSQNILYCC